MKPKLQIYIEVLLSKKRKSRVEVSGNKESEQGVAVKSKRGVFWVHHLSLPKC